MNDIIKLKVNSQIRNFIGSFSVIIGINKIWGGGIKFVIDIFIETYNLLKYKVIFQNYNLYLTH